MGAGPRKDDLRALDQVQFSQTEFLRARDEGKLRIVFMIGESQIGKSTLIKHLVAAPVAKAGNGLERCIVEPSPYATKHNGYLIIFYDTPGLNDA
ncbi:hypothetical protein FVE85_2606 [Porphyridium purpureum]|uniref:G domain-containing protein n=1 Tax=Porphyridium purpureum TaxID=35688 RepID=A0A5J4YT41_PORPP|nr:hypothetical protein FVE85_2606 [Porphyridium purpureum]|eukprot:POR0428..scf227_4